MRMIDRAILGLCLSVLPAVAEAMAGTNGQSRPLYFVQITDTHLGVIDHEKVLAQVVKAINTLPFPIACVVHTGDLVMDNFEKPEIQNSAARLLGQIRVPVHVVAGNHDLTDKSAKATITAWTKQYGPLGATADYSGVRFVFAFTEGLFKKGPVGEFDANAFVERALREAGDKPVLLFQHSPWFDDYYDNVLHPGWPEPARSRWAARVRSGPVKAVITGHCHRNELHWEGDVPVYVGEALARFWGRQPAFRIYAWENGRLSYRTWYWNDAKK